MSFSSSIKSDITKLTIKNSCCKKAFLYGVVFTKCTLTDEKIQFNLENDEYAKFVAELINEFFGKEPTVEKNGKGGRCRVISFSSKSAIKHFAQLQLDRDGQLPLFVEKCPQCLSNFLRGMFFASGRMSDPAKQYLLEFSPINFIDKYILLFQKYGIEMKKSVRRGQELLYLKRSSMLEDFLTIAGLNSAMFALVNAKIESEIKNEANRVRNFETKNIERAIAAAHNQVAIIERLNNANLLSSLPEELEKTAKLRLDNPSLSIPQLAMISVPPISKSGLAHRLKKITELSEQLLNKN